MVAPQTAVHSATGTTISLERLRGFMLWFTGLAGAFVFIEPSPYEVASLLTIMVCATGMALRPPLLPLAALLLLYNIGFYIAVLPVLDRPKTIVWVLVSTYLTVTTLFFAAILASNTQARLSHLLRGYIVAAVIAATVAILAYFHLLPRSDIFLLYDRARGTFNDPNVLGAFLVLPALILFQRVLAASAARAVSAATLLLPLVAALFLSFSRGAWGQFAFAALVLMGLTFLTSRSGSERLRIVVIAALGIIVVGAFLAALLTVPQVADLFAQRVSLDQSYDLGHTGRFGRHALGLLLALDHPFGIGPLQFSTIFPEDPHNAFLNSFMAGGWLSGVSYLTLTLVTLAAGLRFVFVATPWHATYLVVYAAYVGIAAESLIIDSDHWRHYFLILGVMWGMMAAARPYRAARLAAPRASVSSTAVAAALAPGGPRR